MSDKTKNSLSIATIKSSDTISEFMEKCNINFAAIVGKGGGPAGPQGVQGEQGVPTKPKVPIHVWKEGVQYDIEQEIPIGSGYYEIVQWFEKLTDSKYQEGHLIMLQNGHVYILELESNVLRPKFILALQSYNPSDTIDGKSAYVHIAYAKDTNGTGFITDSQMRGEEYAETDEEPVTTYSLKRNAVAYTTPNVSEMPYMGIYTDNNKTQVDEPSRYTWIRIQGSAGPQGGQGEKGDPGPQGDPGPKGDSYTGQLYTIDLEGDMSTISLDVDRTRLYDTLNDYCKCTIHSYYGKNNIHLPVGDVTVSFAATETERGYSINTTSGNVFLNNTKIGKIEKLQNGYDVAIKFTPEDTFVFPQDPIIFAIKISTNVNDVNDGNKYSFVRDITWTIKGIVSTFELEIIPEYRAIKLFKDGSREPETLSISVYKTTGDKREVFNFSENKNKDFSLLYKSYDENEWSDYHTTTSTTGGVDTKDVSCLEFKVVKNYNTVNEEMWDYEDVWAVADGNDGKDGDTWQYIFCRSNRFPFTETNISNPSKWYDESNKSHTDPNEEYIPDEYKDIWFDDHQGVDKDNKYEYQSYRRWDKTFKCWGPYDEPTLYSNYSEDGKDGSGYNAMLSNPVSVIPVGDDDWSVNENSKNQKDYTFVYLYNNTTDITEETDSIGNYKVSISLPDDNIYVQKGNFTVDTDTHNKVNFIPVVGMGNNKSVFDFQSNTQYKLPITLEYNSGKDIDGDGKSDVFTTTINWILSPIKGLSDIEVFVDKKAVNVSTDDTHEFRVGYYLISTNGGKTFIEESANGGNKYDIVLTSEGSNLIPGNQINVGYTTVSIWNNVSYDFVDDNGINKNCYVVLIDKKDKTIIDYTYITPVKDGVNGDDGVSAIHLELTQDYIAVPAKAGGGGVHPDFGDTGDEVISSRMILYDGNVEIENKQINGKYIIEYEFKIDGETIGYGVGNPITLDVKTGAFTINKSIITGDANLECIAKYGKGTFYKTLFIDLEDTPYELEIDKNTLSRKVVSVDENGNITDGHIVDSSINVKVKYWKKGSWCYVTDGDGDVCVEYSNKTNGVIEKVSTSLSKPSSSPSDYTYTLTIAEDNIKNNIIDLEVKIVYKEGGNILSYENIGIINSGIDGATGDPGDTPELIETKRVGFSIEEEKNHYNPDGTINTSSNHWKASIGELGDVGIAQPIYILYEQTWKYKISQTKFVTHYITTTLSGTQGIEGKSRVLFYLGSFEKDKATITGDSIMGHLTPERCDYYIDYKGQAWMRIGQEDKDNNFTGVVGYSGKKDDNTNSLDNWQKSEKVGFLQSKAIHADMINTGTLMTDTAFISGLKAIDIIATNLKVDAAHVIGELSAANISVDNLVGEIIEGRTIKSDTIITGTEDATWQINKDGSGWLANKNIEWDANGLIIQGEDTSIGQGTSIGGAWIITTDGDIKSKNNCVRFNANGSGYIGGFHESSKSNSNSELQKGISWNGSGDVTFYDKVISKPEFININNIEGDSYSVNTTDKATYIFIDDDYVKGNNEITINDKDCTCYRAYLSWFNFTNKIKLENNTICNFTILNHTNKTIQFYISEDQLRLPFSLNRDPILPHHNYRLLNNKNVNYNGSTNTEGSSYGVQTLLLLPGSKLELCFENYLYNGTKYNNFYINNISDFRLCHTEDDQKPGIPLIGAALISTNYDLNTFNNIGGYAHPYTFGKSTRLQHKAFVRLIFGNYISAKIKGELKFKRHSYFYMPIDENGIEGFGALAGITTISSNTPQNIIDALTVNLNTNYTYCIESLFDASDTDRYKITLNIETNDKAYSKAQLVAYSPMYDTIYKSNEVYIGSDNPNEDLEFSFDDCKETFKHLGKNQQNSILDLFVCLVCFN